LTYITIFGTGYVGLITGVCLAHTEKNRQVICVDTDTDKIRKLNNGMATIHEAGLAEKLNTSRGRLHFTTDGAMAVVNSEVIFIAVGTPQNENGSADLKYVNSVAKLIGQTLTEANNNVVIVIKSTVPVGTSKKVKAIIQEELDKRYVYVTFHMASNPEFLKEGTAIDDFMFPDRVVIGAEDPIAITALTDIYLNVAPADTIVTCAIETAELAKYANNTMLATTISLMNEISRIAELTGADITDIQKIMKKDVRISSFINSGIGYGGSCFPKDVAALSYLGEELCEPCTILDAVTEVNETQPLIFAQKMHNYYEGRTDITIAVGGIAFKPGTDDTRDSPCLKIIDYLSEVGIQFRVYDPVAKLPAGTVGAIQCKTLQEACKGADGLLLATEWKEFTESTDYSLLLPLLKQSVIFDGRNMLDPAVVTQFDYISVGRTMKGKVL